MADRRGLNENVGNGAPLLKLAPDMASLRLQVLAFVRAYIHRWGEGPSYGEIAEATGTNRTRARKAVRRLVAHGQLLQVPGARGLALPDRREEALRTLRALGWVVDEDAGRLVPPAHRTPRAGQPVTNRTLPTADRLDYAGCTATAAQVAGDGAAQGGQEDET